ncbi:MAG: hypothetical protein Q4A00_03565 [Flavobacteriaceae bacterium]|nr:hypothetical protein [Flavobacteriaceae bacterium]
MIKKIYILNFVLLVLAFAVFIGGFLAFYYPKSLSEIEIHIEEWLFFFLILLGNVGLSGLLSFIPIKSFSRKLKWTVILAIFNLIFVIWMMSRSIPEYFENKELYSNLEKEMIDEAHRDMKKDSVVWIFEHGLIIDLENYEKVSKSRDSILAKYGVRAEQMGCVIDHHQVILEQKYKSLVKEYLDKRNGKGWEQKMQREIDAINENKN